MSTEIRRSNEPAAERTYFEDLDCAAVRHLEKTYGDSVSPEIFDRMKDLPSKFETPDTFERSYAGVAGESPSPEVVGFSTGLDAPAHIRADHFEVVPGTVLHERIHQLSHPDAARLLGESLYEGVTENYTLRAEGAVPSREFRAYPNETREARRISLLCGDAAVASVYFNGDGTALRECVETLLENPLSTLETTEKEDIHG